MTQEKMRSHKIKRALISVSDKQGLIPLAKGLAAWDIEIISTGGTSQALREMNIPTRDVSDITNFPEIMHGRVKTLHPKIHGGILGQRDKHADAAEINQSLTYSTRQGLAKKAFLYTAQYDKMIYDYLNQSIKITDFPPSFTIELEKWNRLRYGENPHQSACAYYLPHQTSGVFSAKQHHIRIIDACNKHHIAMVYRTTVF